MFRSRLAVLPAVVVLTCLASAGPVAAAETPVSAAEAKRALRDARAALAGPAVAPLAAPSERDSGREATLALRDLATALPALPGALRGAARRLLARPGDPGSNHKMGPEASESPICDANFCVHWSDSPKSAPSGAITPEGVLAALQHSFAIENGRLGWRKPRSDGRLGAAKGRGRGGQVDVYIVDLEPHLYGYAVTDPGQSGARRHGHLVLDNDYEGFPTAPLPSMKVTVAHEYNHILQFNYDSLADDWLFESTATWIEDYVYPEINDYVNFLPHFAIDPGTWVPMTAPTSRIYGEAVWNHWLANRYGAGVVRRTWTSSVAARHFAIAAYQRAIRAFGGRSFSHEFAAFAAATAEWRSDTSFPDASLYPDVRRRGRVTLTVRSARLDNTSYMVARMRSNRPGPVKLVVRAPDGVRSAVALVARRNTLGSRRVRIKSVFLPRGGRARIALARARRFKRISAVIVNADGRLARGGFGYRSDGARYRFYRRR